MQATEQFYAQKHGAQDFLKKPFPRAELFHKVERLLTAERRPQGVPQHADQPAQVVSDSAGHEPAEPSS
jgi:twitching motility two-component system response regulator PilH